MEFGESQNPTPPQGGKTNPDLQLTNINMEIDEGFGCLRSLIEDLQSIREPFQLSLAISLDTIV